MTIPCGAKPMSGSKSSEPMLCNFDLSSRWLAAWAHHEALKQYIQELPSFFEHQSQKNRHSWQQKHHDLFEKASPSKDDAYEEWQIISIEIDEYDHQLRQIIFSPAVTAIVSCYELHIRIAFRIIFQKEERLSARKMRKKNSSGCSNDGSSVSSRS
jgi:hypothetical protein